MAMSRTRSERLNAPADRVWAAVPEAARRVGMSVAFEPASGVFRISTRMSVFSWGENLLAFVRPAGDQTDLEITSSLKFGLADWGRNNKNLDRLFAEVRTMLAAVPVTPSAPAPRTPPPGWYPDPTGRHQLRHWDGRAWSAHVSNNGTTGSDPVEGSDIS